MPDHDRLTRRGSNATSASATTLPDDDITASPRGSAASSAVTNWDSDSARIPEVRLRHRSSSASTPVSQPPAGPDQPLRAQSTSLRRQQITGYGTLDDDHDEQPPAAPLAAAIATSHLELTPFIVTDQNHGEHVVVIISKQRFDNEKRAQTLAHFSDHWALIGHKVTEGLNLLQAAPPLLNIVVRMTLVPYSVSALATGSGLSNETVNAILANPGMSPLFKTTMTLVGALDNPISSTIVAVIPLSLFAIYVKRLKSNANREGLNWKQWAPIAARMFFTRICPSLVIFGSAAIYRSANQASLSTQAENTMIDGLACPAYFQTRGFFDVSSSLALCMAVSAPVELLVGLGIATGAYFIYRGINNVIELACMRKASKVNAQPAVNLSQPPLQLEKLVQNNPQKNSMISGFFSGIVKGLKSAVQAAVSVVSPRAAVASATTSRVPSPSVLPWSTATILAATSSTGTPPAVAPATAAPMPPPARQRSISSNSSSSSSSSASRSQATLNGATRVRVPTPPADDAAAAAQTLSLSSSS